MPLNKGDIWGDLRYTNLVCGSVTVPAGQAGPKEVTLWDGPVFGVPVALIEIKAQPAGYSLVRDIYACFGVSECRDDDTPPPPGARIQFQVERNPETGPLTYLECPLYFLPTLRPVIEPSERDEARRQRYAQVPDHRPVPLRKQINPTDRVILKYFGIPFVPDGDFKLDFYLTFASHLFARFIEECQP